MGMGGSKDSSSGKEHRGEVGSRSLFRLQSGGGGRKGKGNSRKSRLLIHVVEEDWKMGKGKK